MQLRLRPTAAQERVALNSLDVMTPLNCQARRRVNCRSLPADLRRRGSLSRRTLLRADAAAQRRIASVSNSFRRGALNVMAHCVTFARRAPQTPQHAAQAPSSDAHVGHPPWRPRRAPHSTAARAARCIPHATAGTRRARSSHKRHCAPRGTAASEQRRAAPALGCRSRVARFPPDAPSPPRPAALASERPSGTPPPRASVRLRHHGQPLSSGPRARRRPAAAPRLASPCCERRRKIARRSAHLLGATRSASAGVAVGARFCAPLAPAKSAFPARAARKLHTAVANPLNLRRRAAHCGTRTAARLAASSPALRKTKRRLVAFVFEVAACFEAARGGDVQI